MLVALLVGGRVHIFPDAIAHNPAYLLEQVDRHGISILETVPSLLRAMLEVYEEDGASKPLLKKLRWLIPTGEALSANLCRRWLRLYPHVPLLNAYGPTECSDDVTHHPIYQPPAETESYMPIGRALMNTRLYVLNPLMIPVPIGVNGELYVGGVGVGRGYLHDAQRTAQSFIPDPFSIEPGAMLYKTGDLARYLPDGTLEFLGRIDHQVKIRGFRIELGEIETVLKRHPAVRDVIVVAREDVPGDQRLVAYVVLDKERLVAVSDLQNHLVKHLPAYMIPSAFVLLEALPLNSNGKVDRRALPAPDVTRPELREAFVAPRTPIEEMVTGIWSQVLGIEQIGIHDDFFELGGHSLLVMQVTSRLRTILQVDVSLRSFFEAPTIAELSKIIEQVKASDAQLQMPAPQPLSRGGHRMKLSSILPTQDSGGSRGENQRRIQ
jgi:acyl-coenzyme A synthetase/AMP-(fatty) acid ligase